MTAPTISELPVGAVVKVARCYDHAYHTSCYRGRVGRVVWTNYRIWEVEFDNGQSPRPDLVRDTYFFYPGQLRVVRV